MCDVPHARSGGDTPRVSERVVSSGAADRGESVAAWRRATAGENRWPSVGAIVVAIALQWVLPEALILPPRWLLPGVELALLALLIWGNPVRLEHEHTLVRIGSLAL